jgi:hypothetical protein
MHVQKNCGHFDATDDPICKMWSRLTQEIFRVKRLRTLLALTQEAWLT